MTLRTLTIATPLPLPSTRTLWVLGALAALLLSAPLVYRRNVTSAATTPSVPSTTEVELVALTNEERATQGLEPLGWNDELYQAAEAKAKHILAHQYFDHTSPSGITPWSFIRNTGYQYRTAGENLAVGFYENVSVVRAWMRSPSHRANIIDGDFREIAIATESGVLEGEYVTVVVQLFGQPDSVLGDLERQVLGATNQSN